MIKDVYTDNEWHLKAIATIIHPNTVKNIKNVQLKLHCDVQDCFVWLGNLDGNYPASSGYTWSMQY